MTQGLNPKEVNSHNDPSVAKQYDTKTSREVQFKELYDLIDAQKVSMLNTYRDGIGPVGRSMAVAKRVGPDILYVANIHSKKFEDIKHHKEVQVTFQDSKTQDWITISGTATVAANDDPRIKDLYTPLLSVWFGDLKDGTHDGSWKDPRMALIEVCSKYIAYYKKETSTLGFMKEIGVSALTGGVAQTGVLRELSEVDIEKERV